TAHAGAVDHVRRHLGVAPAVEREKSRLMIEAGADLFFELIDGLGEMLTVAAAQIAAGSLISPAEGDLRQDH
ncbi:MAG: hypothetical protein ABI478_08320, partial [Propionivibrio sp.]